MSKVWRLSQLGYRVEKVIFIACSDASQGSMPRGGSQAGLVVAIAGSRPLVEEEAPASLVESASTRIKRVVRSSLGAELAAANVAMEHGEFVRAAWAEMTEKQFEWSSWKIHAAKWPLYLVLDAKTGYDVLKREMVPSDRRTAIDAAALRQTFHEDEYAVFVKWVPGPQLCADSLTKAVGNPMLEKLMVSGLMGLVETEDVRQERARQRAVKKARKVASRDVPESQPNTPPVGLE